MNAGAKVHILADTSKYLYCFFEKNYYLRLFTAIRLLIGGEPMASNGSQGIPVLQVGTLLYDGLDIVRKIGEEVQTSQLFYLINAANIAAHVARSTLVLIDEADGLIVALRTTRAVLLTQYDLEESLWNDDAVASDGTVLLIVEHRSADDVEVTIALSPFTTLQLDIVPRPCIEVMTLWTDVREKERLLLCLAVPLVVTSRTHVTSVVAGATVVGVVGTRATNFHVFMKHLIVTLVASIGMTGSKVPGNPVGDAVLGIVGNGISYPLENLSLTASQHLWNLHARHGLRPGVVQGRRSREGVGVVL